MIKMIISCGGGMSSSALTKHMQNTIKEKGWEDSVRVDFIPFPLLMNPKENSALPITFDFDTSITYDIALLCPHLMYYTINEEKKHNLKIPMYIIPSLLYGKMDLVELMEDAQDLLELYKHSNPKLMHFPEEKLLDIKRNTSHRRWIQKHH